MLRVYRTLLHLYPAGYRREFGGEMASVFGEALCEIRDLTLADRAAFSLREIAGIVGGAAHQHLRHLLGSNDWCVFRRFAMRPEFRFPRSTIGLMAVILLGLFLAIEQAKAVAGGTTLLWSTFWSLVVLAFVLVCVAAVAGWAILFALKRSGTHRLSQVQTWPEQK